MNNIFKQLPIAFPFYEEVKAQEIYKENANEDLFYKLITPLDRLLPFQIELPLNKQKPIKWEIIRVQGNGGYDITPSLEKIKIFTFPTKKQAVYYGNSLITKKFDVLQTLDMICGYYYTKLTFADGSYYASEIFYAKQDLSDCIKIDFWCNQDMQPIIFREGFKQFLYLPTFIHTATPEIEEDVLKDGYNNEIPVYQKLMLKYRFVDIVPDFLKTALVSLQMQDFVYLWISETRQGYVDRVWVNVTVDDTGATNEVEVVFEDDIILKTNCNNNDELQNVSNWGDEII